MVVSDSRVEGVAPLRISAMEAVLGHLRTAIESGDFTIGDKLPSEAELGRRFAVSRPVVREALRALQALGLTVSRAGKGTYVSSPGAPAGPVLAACPARDLLEVRRHVEVPVSAYAAARRSQDDLERLHGLLARMERESEAAAWVALDVHFHRAIARCSGNLAFHRMVEDIRDALARNSPVTGRTARERRAMSNREHRAIVEAIATGDQKGAARTMTAHLDQVERALIAAAPHGAGSAVAGPRG